MSGPSSGSGATIYNVSAQADASAIGVPYALPPKIRNLDIIIQIDIIGGEADVMIQGRLREDVQWKNLMSAVVNEVLAPGVAGLQGFSWVSQIRVVTSNVANTPNIRVELFHG